MERSELLEKMRSDWDQRARENARHYVASGRQEWNDAEFFASGEESVAQYILNDMVNVCQGTPPQQMRVLEIGCGAGRMTRALAQVLGEVYAVDVSGEMINLARAALTDVSNVRLYQNNGQDLSALPGGVQFDFAFSHIVFQHIPSRDVIESYVREVNRVLRPGALFKFQVQGADYEGESSPDDTWIGASFSEAQAMDMADRFGFDVRYAHGAGEQYYWLWFFKRDETISPGVARGGPTRRFSCPERG